MRTVYTILLYLLAPVVFGYLALRALKEPGYLRRWPERLGFIGPTAGPRPIWIHAASLGETQAALPLIHALRRRYPDIPLVVTNITPSGSARVRAELGASVRNVYLPLDLPGAVARFYRHIRPRLGIVMETELWPNLFAAARNRRIPLVLASARLSPRSFGRYQRLAQLVSWTLAQPALIAPQSEQDAERFRQLGAPPEKIAVLGNLKLDFRVPDGVAEAGAALRARIAAHRPVWIAASTREGEEELVLEAFARVRQRIPDVLLILVPRHPQRFDSVAALVERCGFGLLRRSAGSAGERAGADVFLGDTLGELLLFYAAADVAFVGGSLVPVGGHNPLEPAALGLPVLMGPEVANVATLIEQMQADAAARVVPDAYALAQSVTDILAQPKLRERMGAAARRLVQSNRGSVERLLDRIDGLLEP